MKYSIKKFPLLKGYLVYTSFISLALKELNIFSFDLEALIFNFEKRQGIPHFVRDDTYFLRMRLGGKVGDLLSKSPTFPPL